MLCEECGEPFETSEETENYLKDNIDRITKIAKNEEARKIRIEKANEKFQNTVLKAIDLLIKRIEKLENRTAKVK
jgi:hypothetical protein